MRYKIPIRIVELESDNYHLIVESDFADGEKGNWVIDTGASKTVFDKNLAHQFAECDEIGEELHAAIANETPMQTTFAHLEFMQFGKVKLNNLKVALLDLDHINTLYEETCGMKICGLLGSDILFQYKAVIDYKKKHLILRI